VTERLRGLLAAVLVVTVPLGAGLYVGATAFGGTLLPWRPVMVDLDVYRRAGATLLAGGDIYQLPGQLPFLYPPFAALLAAPLALLPRALVEIGWTVAGVLALLAVMRRIGLRGWLLSLVTTASIFLVPSVSQTLAFGQVGIFLVALVVVDLVPGRRAAERIGFGRRMVPEGVWTGLAAAIKLTPAIFVIYLLAVRRWRAAWVCTLTGLLVTGATWLILPGQSSHYWGRLAQGDTGLGHSFIYYTNQSVMADITRILGLTTTATVVGLASSAVVAALGVAVAARWHRLGDVRLAVVLCGLAGLLASPVSWLHHFVWMVPLAFCLLDPNPPIATVSGLQARTVAQLPLAVRLLGLVLFGWLVVAPFLRLPNGADLELLWTPLQNLLGSTTAILGTAFLLCCLLARPVRPVTAVVPPAARRNPPARDRAAPSAS
jgi:alpha-1,2-mannosyltransferase